jgi:PGM1 C-terminal domain
MTFPLHRLLELRDPSALVGVCGPVEPAVLSYYLELIGVGAGDRVVMTVGDDQTPAPAVVTLSDLRAARVPLAEEDAEPAATVRVRIRPDHAVQVLSSHDRLPDGGTRLSSGSAYIDELYRYGARTGARLAAAGAVGAFAVDFTLDEHGRAAALGPSTQPEDHAHATLLALRANAFRAGSVYFDGDHWHDAVATLRGERLAWSPLARAGVVLYGLETFADTGELSLVALGNARTESEQCYEAALTALGAVQAATTLGWAA